MGQHQPDCRTAFEVLGGYLRFPQSWDQTHHIEPYLALQFGLESVMRLRSIHHEARASRPKPMSLCIPRPNFRCCTVVSTIQDSYD